MFSLIRVAWSQAQRAAGSDSRDKVSTETVAAEGRRGGTAFWCVRLRIVDVNPGVTQGPTPRFIFGRDCWEECVCLFELFQIHLIKNLGEPVQKENVEGARRYKH